MPILPTASRACININKRYVEKYRTHITEHANVTKVGRNVMARIMFNNRIALEQNGFYLPGKHNGMTCCVRFVVNKN